MSATSETDAIFRGIAMVAPWALIAAGRLRTYQRSKSSTPKTTTGAAQVTMPAVPVAQPAPRLHAAPDPDAAPAALSAVGGSSRNPRLPKLPPVEETRNPKLAEYARGRQRDEHGHFIPTRSAS